MSTRVRIQHLVLDGITLSRRERDALGPAITRELRRLAARADHPPGSSTAERPRHPDTTVDEIARRVGAAVHRATVAALPPAGSPTPAGTRRGHR